MRDKILKLASSIEDEDSYFYKRLKKIADSLRDQKSYLLIDIQEMESMIDPDKVEEYKGSERVELEL